MAYVGSNFCFSGGGNINHPWFKEENMNKCDFCNKETDKLTTFPNKGFVYKYERLLICSPPSYWRGCPFCTECIQTDTKDALLEHCAIAQCIVEGIAINDFTLTFVRNVIKPLHKAFFESLGAPISN